MTWGQFFLGRVEYLTHQETSQKIVNALGQFGPVEIGKGVMRAQTLLLKRKAFSHEDEVRLIWVCDDKRDVQEAMTVNLEANDFIDEVTFDPRLISFEMLERQANAKSLGYTGAFGQSPLYQKIFFQTLVPWDWKDWEKADDDGSAAS